MNDLPEILYKFRNYEGVKAVDNFGTATLTQFQLFASSSLRFNDPFDNALPFRYSEDSFTLLNFIEKYKRAYNGSTNTVDFLYEATERFNFIKEDPQKNWEEVKDIIKGMDNKFYGILSLTKRSDNLLMWSHYANNHKGYCIGLCTNKLKEFIEENYWQFGAKLGEVDYKEGYPTVDFMEADYRNIAFVRGFTKHICWNYEEEVRIILSNKSNAVIHYPKELIKEIYFGCQMEQRFKYEVIDFLKKQDLDISLYQMEMGFHEFKLIPIPKDY